MLRTKEINFDKSASASGEENTKNEFELSQVIQSWDIHMIEIASMTVCPTSDSLAIQGLQFTIREKTGKPLSQNDPRTSINLPLIGEQRNNCFLFILASGEKITSATVKYSSDGIHYLSFVTSNG